MKIAVAHPGKIGDLLFSLPTAQYLSELYDVPVDVYTSPHCRVALDVVACQPYVRKAVVLEEYVPDHYDMGVQPWEMPVPSEGYDHVYQLGFRDHPDRHTIQFVAHELGLPEPDPDAFELLVPDTGVVAARGMRAPYVVITTVAPSGGGALSWDWSNPKISEFVESCPYPVYAVGLEEEWKRYNCAGRFEGLAGLTFVEIAQVMKGAGAVVTFSTGLGVLAAGVLKGTGVPLVCMFDGEIPWENFRLPGATTCSPDEDLRRMALREQGVDDLRQDVARVERERRKALRATGKLQAQNDTVHGAYDSLRGITDSVRAEKESMREHRDSLWLEKESMRVARDALWIEKESFRFSSEKLQEDLIARERQLESARIDNEQLTSKLAAAVQERSSLLSGLAGRIRRLVNGKPA